MTENHQPSSRASHQRRPASRRDQPLRDWFSSQGWKASSFQREVWARYLNGQSGLLHSPTGSGKTLAAFGGALIEALSDARSKTAKGAKARHLQVLWITPLRALATDTARALQVATEALSLNWKVTLRTGDASRQEKRIARQGKTEVLVTTPESLALLLSYPDTAPQLGQLRCVVVDELHTLLDNKRGVLLQLGLARLRALSPALRCWGLSATPGNLEQARRILLPHLPDSALVIMKARKKAEVTSLLPSSQTRLPWAGHVGLSRLPEIYQHIFANTTTLLFTNTRAQTELWHKALSSVWPENPETLAIHHGSLDVTLRKATEQHLREGSLRCVVATSSLDLGVDFPAVDLVIQIGSPKGVSRLLQRAGRARHRPGETGRILCAPTQALELLEYAAARQAIRNDQMEIAKPLTLCTDVLAQHCITLAVGGGFDEALLFDEVRATHAFSELTGAAWQSVLNFIVQGGQALSHYPDYRRVEIETDGRYRVTDQKMARRHRLNIGTILANGSVLIKMPKGGTLGIVDESFIGRLQPKDHFHFAGRQLQLIQLEYMTAWVRLVKQGKGAITSWSGSTLPLSSGLGQAVGKLLADTRDSSPERKVLEPLLVLQKKTSIIPTSSELLLEITKTRRGHHLTIFPFSGRALHEGLASVLALRLGERKPNSFSITINDYGLMLTSREALEIDSTILPTLLDTENLTDDLERSLNIGELLRRHFREIARVSGLLIPALPGKGSRSMRQLQASSGLIFDVLQRYDSEHILLQQTAREVLTQQLCIHELHDLLILCQKKICRFQYPRWLTPLSFPLWAETLRGHLSTEDWTTRVKHAAELLEKRYDRKRER